MWVNVRHLRERLRSRSAWLALSVLMHAVFFWSATGAPETDDGFRLQLPSELELGVTGADLGADPAPAPAPPPAQKVEAKRAPRPKSVPKPAPDAVTLPVDAGAPNDAGGGDAGEGDAAQGSEQGVDGGDPAAVSGDGMFSGADGTGGFGPGGDGTGAYAPQGATIALNVDLARVRDSALLLETQSLLQVIPEWELLLEGSGLDPSRDLARVFVATPNLTRSSLVLSASVVDGKSRIEAAVARLAKERGQAAPWHSERGFPVAPWWNRGPTRRVIALVGEDQFAITRATDLGRVLSVARALATQRAHEGFSKQELASAGGLLAMRPEETVALWVEGVRRYTPGAEVGVPLSLRLSVNRVDQFNTELRASGRYESESAARAALTYVDDLRKAWSNHPRVVFLGLKSAMDSAVIEQERDTLSMHVLLTLHQTRYLLGYVSSVLTPRDAPP